jgi:hypothetical protein
VTAGHLAQKLQASRGDGAAPRTLAEPPTLVGVDEFVRESQLTTVDFLKVDVDGPDPEVLESARRTLAELQVLAVGVEVNWFGTASPTEHTFHNTDVFLRRAGYTVFGLTVLRYSRTDLPAPFEFET